MPFHLLASTLLHMHTHTLVHRAVSALWPHRILSAGQETPLRFLIQYTVLVGLNPTLIHSHTHIPVHVHTTHTSTALLSVCLDPHSCLLSFLPA